MYRLKEVLKLFAKKIMEILGQLLLLEWKIV
jgi:hypothetical protein